MGKELLVALLIIAGGLVLLATIDARQQAPPVDTLNVPLPTVAERALARGGEPEQKREPAPKCAFDSSLQFGIYEGRGSWVRGKTSTTFPRVRIVGKDKSGQIIGSKLVNVLIDGSFEAVFEGLDHPRGMTVSMNCNP